MIYSSYVTLVKLLVMLRKLVTSVQLVGKKSVLDLYVSSDLLCGYECGCLFVSCKGHL